MRGTGRPGRYANIDLVMLPGDDPAETSRVLDIAQVWVREENPGAIPPACGDDKPHTAHPVPIPDDPFVGYVMCPGVNPGNGRREER